MFFFLVLCSIALLDSTGFINGVRAESLGQVPVLSVPRAAGGIGGIGGITVLPQITVEGDGEAASSMRRVLQNDQDLVDNEGTGGVGAVCYTEVPYDAKRHQQVYTVGVLAIRGFESAYNDFNKSKGHVNSTL